MGMNETRKIGISVASILILTILVLSPILVNQAFAQNQMGVSMMSPKQQWMMTNNIDDITCREAMVLIIRGANATPACVSPNAYLRLMDRGWGMFDANIMADRPQMMQSVASQMIQNPQMMQQMREMMVDNPQQMRDMMGPMMQNIMNDPELRQQMIDQMMQRQQLMQELMQNQQFMQQLNP